MQQQWQDLEHQEQVGVEPRGARPAGMGGKRPVNKRLLLYGALALVPVLLFCLMFFLARK